jgi:hypothetical protein
LAEGLGADYAMTKTYELQKVRDITSCLFYCVPEDDVASMELQKVQDITSFLFFCVQEDDVASQEFQKV